MSYKKLKNKKESWDSYCEQHIKLFTEIGLQPDIYSSEMKFREFATYGTKNGSLDVDKLNDSEFFKLFDFITNYFDMDASIFDVIENRRVKKTGKA